jgi:hypothetical protein
MLAIPFVDRHVGAARVVRLQRLPHDQEEIE